MYESSVREEDKLAEIKVAQVPSDTISAMKFSPVSDILAVCSWDGSIYIYMLNTPGASYENMALKTSIPNSNASPFLCCCFSTSGDILYAGTADGKLCMINMATGNMTEAVVHEMGISSIAYTKNNLIVTGSWDMKIKIWSPANMQVPLNEKTFSGKIVDIDSKNDLIFVSLSTNYVSAYSIYDFSSVIISKQTSSYGGSYMDNKYKSSSMGMGYQSASSDQKYNLKASAQIRRIATLNAETIVAIANILGKVEISHIYKENSISTRVEPSFSFRAHRVGKYLYPINAMLFHPIFQKTLVTAGADGNIFLWNLNTKARIKAAGPSKEWSITSLCFDKTGRFLAYSVGYDWSKGYKETVSIPIEIRIALVPETIHSK